MTIDDILHFEIIEYGSYCASFDLPKPVKEYNMVVLKKGFGIKKDCPVLWKGTFNDCQLFIDSVEKYGF